MDVIKNIILNDNIIVVFGVAIFILVGILANVLNRYLMTKLTLWQRDKLSEDEINSIPNNSIFFLDMINTILSAFFLSERKRRKLRNDRGSYSDDEVDVKDENKEKNGVDKEDEKEENNDLNRDFNYFINMELSAASKTRTIFINMYIVFTMAIIIFFFYFNDMSIPVRLTLSGAYISYSLFSLYIIKTSYRRVSLMISLLEDKERKYDINEFFTKYKKGRDLNRYDVDFLKVLTISRAEREKSTNHPYEVILNSLNDSDVEVNKKGLKISKNKK